MSNVFEEAFMDYAMSVIVSRALPDVRDGLKPVHRRILFAMHDLKINHNRPFKKSARIVGEVIGKYHPHGDTAVYDTMVRLSQTFKMRQPLIDGHGNFGSIDGDSAAAMRYTEARMHKVAHELLRDINKNTVDYVDNFDGEEREPEVLPGLFPQLLVNGTEGIAVGMATSMPPHNLTEVCQAIMAQMDNEDIEVEELLKFIKGPDLPTGGVIQGDEGIKNAYRTGRGTFRVRGVTEEGYINGKDAIVITEIPYQVNKEKLIGAIKQIQIEHDEFIFESKKKTATKLVEKGMNFIHAIRDESEDDIRIVIELKDGTNPEKVKNYLFKHTQLQNSFGIINLALVPKTFGDGQRRMEPQVLTLKEIISEYIKHQREVLKRSLSYDLKEKENEMYLLAAVMKALGKLDASIELIRSAKTREEAIEGLVKLLDIEDEQAKHILALRLQRLASFEQDEQKEAYSNLEKEILEIKTLMENQTEMDKLIKEDVQNMMEEYGTERRTKIGVDGGAIDEESLVDDVEVVVTLSHNGFIKRIPQSQYKIQRKNGRGVKGVETFEDDFVNFLQLASNLDTLMFFTNKGSIYKMKAHQVPMTSKASKGISIRSIFDLSQDEHVQAILSIKEFSDEQFLTFGTKEGIVKRTRLSEYNKSNRNGIAAITLNNDDEVVNVSLTSGDNFVTLITLKGKSITFEEKDVKVVSRQGKGVKGIELEKGDGIVSVVVHKGLAHLFIATNTGIGKRTPLSEFRVQNRGGKGVRAINVSAKTDFVVGNTVVEETDQIILLTKQGTLIKMNSKDISSFSRSAKGSRVINLKDGDELQAVASNSEEEVDLEEEVVESEE